MWHRLFSIGKSNRCRVHRAVVVRGVPRFPTATVRLVPLLGADIIVAGAHQVRRYGYGYGYIVLSSK